MSSCYYPLRAYRDSENNIKFVPSESQSFDINNLGQNTELRLPCGRCLGCRLNHAEGWALRMVHEAQLHEQNAFITLTYDPEHLPEDQSLQYNHVTLFLKKLRKILDKADIKIKYYYVGEYGEKLTRPHYHIVLFGFDFSSKLRYRGKENNFQHWRTKNGNKYYISSLLTDLWGRGHCEIGEVNYNTCMYVAKYVTKKVNGSLKDAHYTRLNSQTGEVCTITPEQARMSRKEAIGRKWLEKFTLDVYPHDHVVTHGKKLKVPRYYDKWLEKNNPALLEEVKLKRESSATVPFDQVEATRIHNVRVLQQKNYISEIEGTSQINQIDAKLLSYHKNEAISLHFQEKNK